MIEGITRLAAAAGTATLYAKIGARATLLGVVALQVAACGGDSGSTAQAAATGAPPVTAPPATARSAVDIFVKDLGLVRDEARRVGSHTPLADAAEALFDEAAAAGLGAEDDSRVIEILRRHRRLGS